MLWQIGGFCTGTALSAAFVVSMNDLIYSQFRRHIIHPVQMWKISGKSNMDLQDIKNISQGAVDFATQFKPHALGRTNLKQLLIEDKDYSTPADHYFSYVMKQKLIAPENDKEQEVFDRLDIDKILPSPFSANVIKELEQPLASDEEDIFEIARRKGQKLSDLNELKSDYKTNKEGPKHSKKDDQILKNISVNQVLKRSREEKKRRQFNDDFVDPNLVKIQKKKTFKNKKSEQKMRDEEIQKMLSNPQDLDYKKAMELYETQPLEAKPLTNQDKRRLRRLKSKAEKSEGNAEPSQIAEGQDRKERQSAVRIDSQTEIPESGDINVDALIK